MTRRLTVRADEFPIRGTFRIARGAKTVARVVTAVVEDGNARGWGEGVPYARYGESVETSLAELAAMADAVAGGLTRDELLTAMRPGAARNALDAALWDWEAKTTGVPAWRRAGLAEPPGPLVTAFTISLDTPEAMAEAARATQPRHPLLKMKLAGEGDLERVAAVRGAAPDARLIVDANEGWTAEEFVRFAPVLRDLGVELIEQPLPAGRDAALAGLPHPIPLCADESAHGVESLPDLAGKYETVCLKLDKTGGLTAALAVCAAAEAAGHAVMVGCMVASSLAMAPAVLLAQGARYVDLDGPLLLASDRPSTLRYDGASLFPPDPVLWG
jgi:L-Ala-D/L-Glu epimerase